MSPYQLFHDFENSYDLKKFMINDIWYYPIVKIQIFFSSINKDLTANKDRKEKSKFDILSDILRAMKWSLRNKTLREVDILSADSVKTRRLDKNALYSNIYFDPLNTVLSSYKTIHYEIPEEKFGHYKNTPNSELYFPDFQIQKILLKAKLGKKKYPLDITAIKDLYDHFNLAPDINDIQSRITKFLFYHDFYNKFLKKIRPKLVIINYPHTHPKMALMYACTKLRIPTIELQHGIIYESHMAYIYQKAVNRDMFPDYIFTFGDFFSELIVNKSVMFKKSNVYSIGYPYLEQIKKNDPVIPSTLIHTAKSNRIIYITSQGIVRDMLIPFILEIERKLDDKYVIVFKPHPSEMGIDLFYKEFENKKRIILIKDNKLSSVELMKIAYIHSTVVSTSFFEASYLGLPNIFINDKKYTQYVSSFVDNDTNFLAHTPQEFIQFIDAISEKYELISRKSKKISTRYYKKNSIDNFKSKIDLIMKRDLGKMTTIQ